MNTDSRLPGELCNVDVQMGDDVLCNLPRHLIIKVDVEGHEEKVLKGLRTTIESAESVWLCIEDANRQSLFECLNKMGFVFKDKRTPYNSWWLREPTSNWK